eukprot:6939859-Prymnesium_polylepis.2
MSLGFVAVRVSPEPPHPLPALARAHSCESPLHPENHKSHGESVIRVCRARATTTPSQRVSPPHHALPSAGTERHAALRRTAPPTCRPAARGTDQRPRQPHIRRPDRSRGRRGLRTDHSGDRGGAAVAVVGFGVEAALPQRAVVLHLILVVIVQTGDHLRGGARARERGGGGGEGGHHERRVCAHLWV